MTVVSGKATAAIMALCALAGTLCGCNSEPPPDPNAPKVIEHTTSKPPQWVIDRAKQQAGAAPTTAAPKPAAK